VAELISIIPILVIFLTIPFLINRKKVDLVAISVFAGVLACIITFFMFPSPTIDFIGFIQFPPLLYIISINIIIIIVEKQNIFQYIALKTIHFTKSNPRKFFYFICLLSGFSSAVIEDVSVAMIFIPLIIRACRLLEIKPQPFLFGIAVCLNIGNIFAPFSNSQNLIISNDFNLTFGWFGMNLFPVLLILMFSTIFFIDMQFVRKQAPPTDLQKQIILEIMNPTYLIINRKKFMMNAIAFACIIVFLFIIPLTFVVGLVGAVVLCIINKESMSDLMEKVDWKIIFFFISLFLIVGCMVTNGTMGLLADGISYITSGNVYLTAILVLIFTSLLSSFFSPNPTTLLFIPILEQLFVLYPELNMHSSLILVALFLGLNVGGKFLPQGVPPYMITISIAQKFTIEDVDSKNMMKVGSFFSVFHILIGIAYITIISLILGVF
jgi:Na+/H+ antiporter NhaD/arsenite permease-like protein